LLEAIEAMRLRREAKRGATMRPASQARRTGIKRRAPPNAPRVRRSPLCAYCLWGGSGYKLPI